MATSKITTTALVCAALAISWRLATHFLSAHAHAPCDGFVHPDFQGVKDVFCRNVASGVEQGATFAVYHKGEPLINLWGGHADLGASRPWTRDTVTQAWSCTKGVTALVMAMLVDRGLLNYSAPVRNYWPEFASNGKENITLETLLSHKAGLMSIGRQISLPDYRDDWADIERRLASKSPDWRPGTLFGYHAFTLGMYADALVRKVDTPRHRNISQFFKEEVAQPLGVDFHIGLPLEQYHRSTRGVHVSTNSMFVHKFLLYPSMWSWLPEAILKTRLRESIEIFDFMQNVDKMNDPELRSVGLSSSNGHGTAASLAQIYDFLANDGAIKGKRLLSSKQIVAMTTPATVGITKLATLGEGEMAMTVAVEKNRLGQKIFGHRGYGGQNAFADPTNRVGVAYLTNFNSDYGEMDDPRAAELLNALYRCLQARSGGGKAGEGTCCS